MKKSIFAILLGVGIQQLSAQASHFIEAESFVNQGGWVLDTQFIETMGSPYLMAHGLGKPVATASTEFANAKAQKVRVWVRTKNWVGVWDAEGAPGQFQVTVQGKALDKVFGTTGKEWLWEDGGVIEIPAGNVQVGLQDLTGFNGRVDAIYLSADLEAAPPSEKQALAEFRQEKLGWSNEIPATQSYDLVVVGGGYGGMGAAISAARQGLKVALVQNRGVLGGNGSSEVQVWSQGGTRRGLYPHLGEIVEEFADRASNSPGHGFEYGDAHKEAVIRKEKNIDLFLFHHVIQADLDESGKRIQSVVALDVKNSKRLRFVGKLFSDCTGHGTLGYLAGASYEMAEKGHLGMSNMWVLKRQEQKVTWPETPWALKLTLEDFPEPRATRPQVESGNQRNMKGYALPDLSKINPKDYLHGEWFWESGFDKHPIDELEEVRDWNLRAVFGAYSTLRKELPENYEHFGFEWLAYIGGTRESRRLIGDVVLTEEQVVAKHAFEDGCVPTTWELDLHYPREQFMKRYPDNPFISRAVFGQGVDRRVGYPLPYRAFYSKDLDNLFMAGRNISVDRGSLGSTRVMRTIGMMGEVVGKAAYLCVENDTTPRGVYQKHLDDLKGLMSQPGAMRRDQLNGPLYLPEERVELPEVITEIIPLNKLEGMVMDDADAELHGNWTQGRGLQPYGVDGYRYSTDKQARAKYRFEVKQAGEYEVRVNWQPHQNRNSKVPVRIHTADGVVTVTVNQQESAALDYGFQSLGKFKFEPGQEAAVIYHVEGNGHVHLDMVQVIPLK